MSRIYLDNAASTPMASDVMEHMIEVLRKDFGNPSSVHAHGRNLRAIIEQSRKNIASVIGASPAEVFFTSGGTEADNIAIKCSAMSLGVEQLISTRIEHHAVTHPIEELESNGMPVTWLNVDALGFPDLNQLEDTLKSGKKAFVSLMHANNELGTMIDLEAIAALCDRYGAILHSDTVQSMAHVNYNLASMPIHFVTASAHKFYGPKGVGFLYVKAGTKIPALICGGSQERNMRAGTENVAGISALAFALNKCYGAFEDKTAHLRALKARMKAGLEQVVPGVSFNGAIENHNSIPTVLNTAFPSDEQDSMLLFNLDIAGISASGGSACTSGSLKGSHVLHGIGCDPKRAANSVRFSFGVQNTIEEIDLAVAKIAEFVRVKV